MSNIPVLTVNQVCDRWHCCRATVMNAIAGGKLKAFRIGRSWRLLLVEVEKYESARVAA
jgi:excisionase family DNA binding protein